MASFPPVCPDYVCVLEDADLRVLVFGEVWEPFLTTLVGALINLIAYKYSSVTALVTTPQMF